MEQQRAIPPGYMTTGELAGIMGTTVRTLQFYDKENLLTPTSESEGGRRLYVYKDIFRLYQIQSLKSLGLSLSEIKTRLAAQSSPADAAEMLSEQADAIRIKIADLTDTLDAVEKLAMEMVEMTTVDYKKCADIITLLKVKNENWRLIKYFDSAMLEHLRNNFNKENGKELIIKLKTLIKRIDELQEKKIPHKDEQVQAAIDMWEEAFHELKAGDETTFPWFDNIAEIVRTNEQEYAKLNPQFNSPILMYLETYMQVLDAIHIKEDYASPVEKEDAVRIVLNEDFPQARTVGSVEGKGLVNFNTQTVVPEVFYQTSAKLRSSIVIENGILYFGNENREFFAIDVASKQKKWSYKTELPVQTTPVFCKDRVIFNAGNCLYILDSSDGKVLHKIMYPAVKTDRVSDEPYAHNDSYAAVLNGEVYFAALDGDIVAADMETGEITWTVSNKLSVRGAVASGINVWDKKLYFIDNAGSLCCVDTQTRKTFFQTQLNDRIFAPMHIDNGKIYLAGRTCRVYCVDAETGGCLWSSYSADPTTWFAGGCVTVGGILYAGTSNEHTVAAFDKNTGEFLRLYPTGEYTYTPPVLNGQNLIVAATNVEILANVAIGVIQSYVMEFDTKNHTKLWQARLDDSVLSAPAVYGDAVYFGSDSGAVYKVKLKNTRGR